MRSYCIRSTGRFVTLIYSPFPAATSTEALAISPAPKFDDFKYLHEFGSRNKETLAELLLGFFQYYSWDFDYKHHVVSIQHVASTNTMNTNNHQSVSNTTNNSSSNNNKTPPTVISLPSKLLKAETYAWNTHSRLSVEDPFELHYDVAHVLKGPQMAYIRKEFLVNKIIFGFPRFSLMS